MKIAGIQKLTLLDFPGHTACTVFLAGCNMRCGYCHNQELVIPECIQKVSDSFFEEETFFKFLEQRKGLLDGVCITGGEPTLQPELKNFISKIKERNFKVKLDTNGTNAKILKTLIEENLLDYIAMDIKSSFENYPKLTKIDQILLNNIKQSKDLIMNSPIEYEFRTTVIKEIHTNNEMSQLLENIKGATKYYLQNFQKKGGYIDPTFENHTPLSPSELKTFQKLGKEKTQFCGIRD